MGFLKLIFAFGGGPMAWLATAWSWVCSAVAFCVKHWKVTVSVIALVAAFYGGMRHERAGWETKWAARDAEEALIESEHQRVVKDLEDGSDRIEADAQKKAAARAVENAALKEKVKAYEEAHRNDTCGIGDDGMRLIADAIRSRRAGEGDATGPGSVPGPVPAPQPEEPRRDPVDRGNDPDLQRVRRAEGGAGGEGP